MDKRLQKFVRLAEIGSFTAAARELRISQPALSIAIDKLEHELDTPLLVRGNRRLDLTEAGKLVYEAALRHQTVADNLATDLVRLARKRPSVTIGMTDSVAALVCATPAFEHLEAAANVTIVVNNSRFLREAVLGRTIDVAFVVDDGQVRPNIVTRPVGHDSLALVIRPDHMTVLNKQLSAGKITQFIAYDKPSTTYQHIARQLGQHGIAVHSDLFSTSPDVMLYMVLRGKGVAALPEHMVTDLVTQKQLSRVTIGGKKLIVKLPLTSLRLEDKVLADCLVHFLKNISFMR